MSYGAEERWGVLAIDAEFAHEVDEVVQSRGTDSGGARRSAVRLGARRRSREMPSQGEREVAHR